MRWIQVLIIFIFLYVNPATAITSSKEIDNRTKVLENFLKSNGYSMDARELIKASDKYNLDFRLLPAIAGVESTFCRNYRLNCFGWASDTIPASPAEVARKITTLSYYREWQKDKGNIWKLAKIYNGGDQKKWEANVRFFMEAIR